MANALYDVSSLRAFCEMLLQRFQVSAGDAQIITDTLITANQRGIATHGIGKIGDYIDRVVANVMLPATDLRTEKDNGAVVTLDANNGFGQVAAFHAMRLAIDRAEQYGISMVLVKNSNHFGIASYYSLMAAQKNLIGITASTSSPGIAPFGARENLFGTNPISVAVPGSDVFPLVLDMSSSVVARGKIRQAVKNGAVLPSGWARNKQGLPTTDPQEALAGSLEPIGGAKGSGIALMVELLCGVLSGSSLPGDVRVIKDLSAPCRTSHHFIAISPDFFTDAERFLQDVASSAARVHHLTPTEKTILLPGEAEYLHAQAHQSEIPLSDADLKVLLELGLKYDVKLQEVTKND